MESTRVETLIRFIKTTLGLYLDNPAVPPPLGEDYPTTREQLREQLAQNIQANPLFTPSIASVHPEMDIYPTAISTNPSWSISRVISITLDSDDIFMRYLVATNFLHSRDNINIMDRITELVDQFDNGYYNTFLIRSQFQYFPFDELLSRIHNLGGFSDVLQNDFIIQNIIKNTNMPIGTIIHLAAATGVPNAHIDWVKNPLYMTISDTPKTTELLKMSELYLNQNPTNLRELLELVKYANPIDEIQSGYPNKVRMACQCLVPMMRDNPAWDPQMESEFKDIVWPIVWKCIRIMFDTEWELRDLREVRLYLHQMNPSWFLNRTMCTYFEQNQTPNFTQYHLREEYKDRENEYVFVKWNPIQPTFRDEFIESFPKKTTHSVDDILWFIQCIPTVTLYDHIIPIIKHTELKGEAAKRIVHFLYKKWVCPCRRQHMVQKVRTILKINQHTSSQTASVYKHIITNIASFLTV